MDPLIPVLPVQFQAANHSHTGPLEARLAASASVLELGKSLALECVVDGYPIHSVVFRHNRRVIKSIVAGAGDSVTHLTPGAAAAAGAHQAKQQQQRQPAAGHHDDSYFVLDDDGLDGSPTPVAAGPASASASDSAGRQDEQSDSAAGRLSHVIVIVLEPEHAGAYQCQASNQFETAHSVAYIKVLDDPPKFRETFRAQVIDQQRDLSLQCAARANPLPEITWSVDGEQVPESSRVRFGDFVTKVSTVGGKCGNLGKYPGKFPQLTRGFSPISHRTTS